MQERMWSHVITHRGAETTNDPHTKQADTTVERIKDGKPVYREIVFPVTNEFPEKLYGEFDKEYEKEKQKGKESPDKESDRAAEKNKAKKDKDPEKEKEVAQTR